MSAPATVLIADDHPVMLAGLRALLDAELGFTVVAQCFDGGAALHQIRELKPVLALLDMSMPGLTGLDILAAVATEQIGTRVVFLSATLDDGQIAAASRGGAYGIVLKEAATDRLLECLRVVASGQKYLPSHMIEPALARERAAKARRATQVPLTPREQEVADLVVEGLSNKEIARRLNLTEGTVKVHLHKVYDKLDVTNRASLARHMGERRSTQAGDRP